MGNIGRPGFWAIEVTNPKGNVEVVAVVWGSVASARALREAFAVERELRADGWGTPVRRPATDGECERGSVPGPTA